MRPRLLDLSDGAGGADGADIRDALDQLPRDPGLFDQRYRNDALDELERLMAERDAAMEVARGAEHAAFEMRGELGAAYMCQTCGGAGTVEDVKGDFETCPGCGVEWFRCAEREAEADAEKIRLRIGLGAVEYALLTDSDETRQEALRIIGQLLSTPKVQS